MREEFYYSGPSNEGSSTLSNFSGSNLGLSVAERAELSINTDAPRRKIIMMKDNDPARTKAKAVLASAVQENRAFGFQGDVDALEKGVYEELSYSTNDYMAKMREYVCRLREATKKGVAAVL